MRRDPFRGGRCKKKKIMVDSFTRLRVDSRTLSERKRFERFFEIFLDTKNVIGYSKSLLPIKGRQKKRGWQEK